MEEYRERVKEELKELTEKRNRLSMFFGGYIFGSFSEEDQKDLITQFTIMGDYAAILEKRISRF